MNKRIEKLKKTKKRYDYGITHLSEYCELPKEVIVKEVGKDLWKASKPTKDKYDNEFYPFLDSTSIGLMWKFKTGWAGREDK